MKAFASAFVCTGLLLGSGAVVGCDRTVKKTEMTETNRDGSTETKTEKKVVESDGTVKTERETEKTPPTNPPANP